MGMRSRTPLAETRPREHRRRQRCLDERRGKRIHPDVVRRQLERHRLGKPFERMLGHAIDGPVHRSDVPHLGRYVCDCAAALPPVGRLQHFPRCRLGDAKCRLHVELDQSVQVRFGHLDKGLRNVGARVVDQYVQPGHGGKGLRQGGGIGDVAGHSPRLPARFTNLGRGLLDFVRGSVP